MWWWWLPVVQKKKPKPLPMPRKSWETLLDMSNPAPHTAPAANLRRTA